MHFPYMMSKIDHGAEIMVYDGSDSRGNLLTRILVKNETWTQSVTSTRYTIYIEYKPKLDTPLLMFIDLVASLGEPFARGTQPLKFTCSV